MISSISLMKRAAAVVVGVQVHVRQGTFDRHERREHGNEIEMENDRLSPFCCLRCSFSECSDKMEIIALMLHLLEMLPNKIHLKRGLSFQAKNFLSSFSDPLLFQVDDGMRYYRVRCATHSQRHRARATFDECCCAFHSHPKNIIRSSVCIFS